MARRSSGTRLSEEQKDRIVELKLSQIPVRAIAAEIPCAVNTVTDHWRKWLDETAEDRREHLERHREQVVARLEHNAAEARRGAIRSRAATGVDPDERLRAEARFLAVERQALRQLSQVAGLDAPTRVQMSFETMTEDEAARILAELDDDADSG